MAYTWFLKVCIMVNKTNTCGVCKRVESDQNKLLTCKYCLSVSHLRCIDSTSSAIHNSTDYFCTHKCANNYDRIMKTRNSKSRTDSSFGTDLKSAIASETQAMKETFRSVTSAIEKSQEFLASKFDLVVVEFNKLKLENEQLRKELQTMKNSYASLTNVVQKLETSADLVNKSNVVKNAIFYGIPQKKNENIRNVVSNVINDVLSVSLSADEIVSASRIGSSTSESDAMRPVRVVFQDVAAKNRVFTMKKRVGTVTSKMIDPPLTQKGRITNITIRDELTPLNAALFKNIREKQDFLRIKFVWIGKGGVVLVKKNERSKPVTIKCREDLNRLFRTHSKTSSSDTNMNIL